MSWLPPSSTQRVELHDRSGSGKGRAQQRAMHEKSRAQQWVMHEEGRAPFSMHSWTSSPPPSTMVHSTAEREDADLINRSSTDLGLRRPSSNLSRYCRRGGMIAELTLHHTQGLDMRRMTTSGSRPSFPPPLLHHRAQGEPPMPKLPLSLMDSLQAVQQQPMHGRAPCMADLPEGRAQELAELRISSKSSSSPSQPSLGREAQLSHVLSMHGGRTHATAEFIPRRAQLGDS
ncbi:hypothetical protein Dimus_010751 [Dionaea muscipula]